MADMAHGDPATAGDDSADVVSDADAAHEPAAGTEAVALAAGAAPGISPHGHELHPHHHLREAPSHNHSDGYHSAVGHLVHPPGHHVEGTRRRPLTVVAGVIAGVLVLVGLGAVVLGRVDGSQGASASEVTTSGSPGPGLIPHASSAPDATSSDLPAMLPAAQPTLVLGDSLGLDVYPWLADSLPDRYVSYAAEVGRSTPATAKALEALSTVPPVVIVSSGTNDGAAAVVEGSARAILDRLGTQRCVVWVDVARPSTIGDSQEAINAAIVRATAGRPNVRVLRWSEMVAAHPEWMGGDGIHPNNDGARARAEAMANAAAGCSPIDPAAPIAPRQVLPMSMFLGPVSTQYRQPAASAASTNSDSATSSGSASATASPSPDVSPSTDPTTTSPSPPPTVSTSSTPTPSDTKPSAATAAPSSS